MDRVVATTAASLKPGRARSLLSSMLQSLKPARQLVQRNRPGHRDVERLAGLRNRRAHVAPLDDLRRQPLPLCAENEDDFAVELERRQRRSITWNERDPRAAGLVELRKRHSEERAHRRAERLRAGRVGAPGRERHAGAERIRRADQRPDVAGICDAPQRDRHRPHAPGQIIAPVDAEHTRSVRERRHLREERGLDVLARDEEIDGIGRCGLDEILTFRDEQPELVAPAPVVELADELEPRVVAGSDQAGTLDSASAALARSAIAAKAAGSLTARSARTLRSSSIPALPQPLMNWLYDRPFRRAAALILVIQSCRNVRFFAFRSR